MDWKDALGALRNELPEGEDPTVSQTEKAPSAVSAGSRLDILLDRKGRKGKEATLIVGFECDDEKVAEIASKLKQRLGVGGSARGGEILIQGDKRQSVQQALAQLGYKSRII